MIALSFSIIYHASKFFHLGHAVSITIGGYLCYLFFHQLSLNLWYSIPLSIFCTALFGLGNDFLVFKRLRRINCTSWQMLIASLGVYVIFQNLISLIWGNSTKILNSGRISTGNEIWGAYITDIQIIILCCSAFLFASIILIVNQTRFGKAFRAVFSNTNLCDIYGVKSQNVIMWSFGLGSAIAALGGILIGFDNNLSPTMGFNVFLYGVIAMIIGGVGNFRGLIIGALILATAQHIAAWYLGKWLNVLAFIILILFLIWKPLGFSGKRVRKVEV